MEAREVNVPTPRATSATPLGQKIALIILPIALAFLLVSAGELYCRWFTRVNFIGISRGLFVSHAFGDSYGNRPNYRGIAFGSEVQTDTDGFRIDPDFPAREGDDAVLVLGDSVSFGVGVDTARTVVGLLQRANAPKLRFYNSSAIGYGLHDYKNVATTMVPRKPDIKYAMLFYCLNDIHETSAQEIEAVVNEADGNSATPNPFSSFHAFALSVNAFLRSRSKLYLSLKPALTDPAARYFQQDLEEYQRHRLDIADRLQALRQIAEIMAAKDIAFEVFVMPYEAQLRMTTQTDVFLPQRLVDGFLRKNGIRYFDAITAFQRSGSAPTDLYLYGDPMHLSADGHRLSFQFAQAELESLVTQQQRH